MTSTSAKGNKRKELLKLIERLKRLTGERKLIAAEADKGYKSAELGQEVLNKVFFPLIPVRKQVNGATSIREWQTHSVNAYLLGIRKNAF